MPHIYCDYIDDLSWLPVPPAGFRLQQNIHLWRMKVSNGIEHLNSLQPILNVTDRERIERYASAHDRQRRVVSRAVVKILLVDQNI